MRLKSLWMPISWSICIPPTWFKVDWIWPVSSCVGKINVYACWYQSLEWRGGFVRVSSHMILFFFLFSSILSTSFTIHTRILVSIHTHTHTKIWAGVVGYIVFSSSLGLFLRFQGSLFLVDANDKSLIIFLFIYRVTFGRARARTPLRYEMNIEAAHLNVWLIGAPLTLNRKHLNIGSSSPAVTPNFFLTFDKTTSSWLSNTRIESR